jgi:hypothetical protein
MPIPVVPVRPIVTVQVPMAVAVNVAVRSTGSAASHRVLATRRETVLRYRKGNSTQQYCHHHDAF